MVWDWKVVGRRMMTYERGQIGGKYVVVVVAQYSRSNRGVALVRRPTRVDDPIEPPSIMHRPISGAETRANMSQRPSKNVQLSDGALGPKPVGTSNPFSTYEPRYRFRYNIIATKRANVRR